MRFSAGSLAGTLTTILLTSPLLATAFPQQGAVELNELFGRQVSCNGGQVCGYSSQLCCVSSACYTDTNNEASCKTYLSTTAAAAAATGYYSVATVTYTTSGQYTLTSTYTTYIAGATAATTATLQCSTGSGQESCGNICCASSQYCAATSLGVGTCSALVDGTTAYVESYNSIATVSTDSAGVPVRATSNTLTTVTVSTTTASTTTAVAGTTEPFETPVATGTNVTIVSAASTTTSASLSGGAIAGIVIGVLLALAILGLICFYCCLKGILDGCLAIFGIGRKRERKEVDIYERRTHHSSGGAVEGRTWYGKERERPARVEERRSSETKNLIGIGAALAALWAILGLKRRNERRKTEEKQEEYSDYSSYTYDTSESSASSDRRTREERRSSRR